jgi:transposase
MKLTKDQWEFISKRLPKPPGGGRRRHDSKRILEAVLWILKTGARWRDLPAEYPSYQTCHRRFQEWRKAGVMREILEDLVRHLQKKGKINLAETFIDASFVEAKKGAQKLAPPSAGKALKSWQSSIIRVFLSPYPLQVLHRMRVRSLKERFGRDIRKTFLVELSETKLTIVIPWTEDLLNDIESGLLLPISRIENVNQLKMEDLYAATNEDGR